MVKLQNCQFKHFEYLFMVFLVVMLLSECILYAIILLVKLMDVHLYIFMTFGSAVGGEKALL